MKTIIDLLQPPCPEEALGYTLSGLDFDSPALAALQAYYDEQNLIWEQKWESSPPDQQARRQWLDQIDRAATQRDRRWHRLRHRARGRFRHIDPMHVPMALLLAWIESSSQWPRLARNDFRRALGLYKKLKPNIISEPYWKAWSPCPIYKMHQQLLRAADGVLAIWSEDEELTYMDRNSNALADDSPLHARPMREGELCGDNDDFAKYWRNHLLKIVGNSWESMQLPELTEAQRGYMLTFMERLNQLPEIVLEAEDESPTDDDDDDDDGPATCELPLSSFFGNGGGQFSLLIYSHGFFDSYLAKAALQSRWSEKDMKNPIFFLQALRLETLSKQYQFYNGHMGITNRCASTPSDEEIIAELRRIRETIKNGEVYGVAEDNEDAIKAAINTELNRIFSELIILSS